MLRDLSNPHWGLLVGRAFAISKVSETDGAEKWCYYTLDEELYLKLCAKNAGFAYPLLSDIYGQVE